MLHAAQRTVAKPVPLHMGGGRGYGRDGMWSQLLLLLMVSGAQRRRWHRAQRSTRRPESAAGLTLIRAQSSSVTASEPARAMMTCLRMGKVTGMAKQAGRQPATRLAVIPGRGC